MPPATPPHKGALVFILMTIALDSMGIGLILPVLPELIAEIDGATLSRAAIWAGVLATAYAVMQFLCAPFLGSLSDSVGRKPLLMLSRGVMAGDYLVMALTGSIWWLLAGRIVAGITAANMATANAVIADITPPAQKSARFGLVGAAFGMGFILGPLLGGLLAGLGTRAPFYAAGALALVNLALGALALPETLAPANRRRLDLRRANPLRAFGAIGRLPGVGHMLLVYGLYEGAMTVYSATWAFYTRAQFGWDAAMIGLSLALFGLSVGAVQGGLIRPVLRVLGERGAILWGLGYSALSFLVLAVLTSGPVALALVPLTALGAVVTPAVQGLMSQAAGDDRQGELQGVISSVRSLAMILGPVAMTQVFAAFTAPGAGVHFPGAAFVLAMALIGLCAMVLVATGRKAVVA